jgi:hypothetical protein
MQHEHPSTEPQDSGTGVPAYISTVRNNDRAITGTGIPCQNRLYTRDYNRRSPKRKKKTEIEK